jgi:hypothetical protein
MKQFDYIEFNDATMVFDAEKYTPEQALEIAKKADDVYDDFKVEDVKEKYCAFRFDPDTCQEAWGTNGAYFIVPQGRRGSFKVYVVGV